MKDQSKYEFEIIEHLGTICVSPSGWTLELNIVSWRGKPAKYDLRYWNPEHLRFDKGVRFNEENLPTLYRILKERLEGGE